MKRISLLALAFLLAVGCAALGLAEDGGYWVDLPDELHIILGEDVIAYCGYPEGSGPYDIECTGDGIRYLGVGFTERGPYIDIEIKEAGPHTLHFFTRTGFSRDVTVIVEAPSDTPMAITLDQNPVVLALGETKSIHYTVEGAVLSSPVRGWNDYAISLQVSEDAIAVTGLRKGHWQITLRQEMGVIDVFVVDPCQGIRLTTPYDRGSVGYDLPLYASDKEGEPVFAYMELTEGQDCAEINSQPDGSSLRGLKPGWVTVKAYGTDGSTAEVRLEICREPEETIITLPSQTVAAGDSLTVTAEYLPEGSWKPLQLELPPVFQEPASEGLEGPVAVADENRIIGLVPGTCRLEIFFNEEWHRYSITVTDSDQALVIDRPQPVFDWREPFQLSVHTRAGEAVPVEYTALGPFIHVTETGLLTADEANAYGAVEVLLENGVTYRFNVQSRETPAWLKPEAEIIAIPIDYQDMAMCEITADVPITAPLDLVICSNDESVVEVVDGRLRPKALGTAALTVWSRYGGVSCTVLAVVTEPVGRLFVDGVPDDAGMDIAYDTVADLPVVTDYQGNPVNVTWKITHQSVDSHNPYSRVVSLVDGKKLKCHWMYGAAELMGTAANGATMHLTVFPYRRATNIAFRESEYTIQTGEFAQVDLVYGEYGMPDKLSPQDVTFAVTGDTDCVLVDAQFAYHTFTGLREGEVTLTATLYNGRTATAVIHVVTANTCLGGHDPVWTVEDTPGETRNGVRVLRCSRCRVLLGQQEAIPCTGRLTLFPSDLYVTDGGDTQFTQPYAALNGDPRHSFTFHSSDPDTAAIVGGIVMGMKPGTVEVTVTAGDCTPAACRVHVLPFSLLDFPDDLEEIEEGAFEGVSATHAFLPDGVKTIGPSAFADCPYLMEAVIPASVTRIGENAFDQDPLLTLIVTPGSYAEQYCAANGLDYLYLSE